MAKQRWNVNNVSQFVSFDSVSREPRKKLLPRAKPCLSMETMKINHAELILVSGLITQLLITRLTRLSGLNKLTRLSLLISQAASLHPLWFLFVDLAKAYASVS